MMLLPYQQAFLCAVEQRRHPRPPRRMPKPRPIRGKSGVVIIDEFHR